MSMYKLKQDLKKGVEVSPEFAKLMPELVEESDWSGFNDGDTYWYIDYHKKVVDYHQWVIADVGCDGDVADRSLFDLGNIFKTEQEAQEELNYRLAEAELKRVAKRLNGDGEIFYFSWYCIAYYENKFICSEKKGGYKDNNIGFRTYNQCAQAIAEMGETRLKNYFRVK